MTLTTEQLRERIGHLKERLRDMKQHKHPDNCPNAAAYLESLKVERQQDIELLEELLANREAQPMGYAENGKGFIYPPERRDRIKNPVAVYTAPPAPAVPDCFLELLKHAGGMAMGTDWNSGTAAKYHRTKLCEAVEACRAAMLAQPVSSGYKLVPVELTEGMYHAFSEMPGQSSSLEDTWAALLAAAQEGGK